MSLDTLPSQNNSEVAFFGRSNVGKSSLINSLTNKKKLAKFSKTPGRTRQLNFFKIENKLHRLIFVDLPGYGFAKSSKAKKKDWGPLLGEYFQKRKALTAVIIFMDIRHPLKESDWDMIQLCRDFNVPFIPVLTKSDKLSNNKITNTVKLVKNKVNEADAIAVSSKDITGFDKLSKEILNFID